MTTYIPEPDETVRVIEGYTDDQTMRQVPTEHADLTALEHQTTTFRDTGYEAAPTIAATGSGWIHPMHRARKPRRVDPYLAGRMRAEVAIPFPMAPEPVLEAHQAAFSAIDAFEEAGRAVMRLGQDAEDERVSNDHLVADAYRAGKPTPKLKRTDWESMAVVRKIQHDEAYGEARKAVAAFIKVMRASRPEWLETIKTTIEPSRSEAREALNRAARALREWRASVDAADRLSQDLGLFGPAWHQAAEPVNAPLAMSGLADLEKLVHSDDCVVSGDYLLTEDELSPPAHTRAALLRQSMAGVDWARLTLAEILEADKRGEIAEIAMNKNLIV